MNNITKLFWGLPEPDKFVDEVVSMLGPHSANGLYAGDNLVVFGRNLGFLADERFGAAFRAVVGSDNYIANGIMWRLYLFAWAARTCLRREGDFVECGVAEGLSSAIMCHYLNFATVPKRLYLYDAWGRDDRVDGTPYGFTDATFSRVQTQFQAYPNVRLVPGFVPETLDADSPDTIAFLHIDLNSAEAELAVLDRLFDRVTPGGIVLFDDFGFHGYSASQSAETSWAAERGYLIAELPTGQGLLIK